MQSIYGPLNYEEIKAVNVTGKHVKVSVATIDLGFGAYGMNGIVLYKSEIKFAQNFEQYGSSGSEYDIGAANAIQASAFVLASSMLFFLVIL